MKFLISTAWLFGFLALGEGIQRWWRVPIPGSVIGMVLLLLALLSGLVKPQWLEPAADLLLSIMGLLFVAPGIGALSFLHDPVRWLVVLGVIVIGALITMGITGHIIERWIHHDR
ncbi:MAG: CidA/LrgA family protein [Phycisphaerae bacterium]